MSKTSSVRKGNSESDFLFDASRFCFKLDAFESLTASCEAKNIQSYQTRFKSLKYLFVYELLKSLKFNKMFIKCSKLIKKLKLSKELLVL